MRLGGGAGGKKEKKPQSLVSRFLCENFSRTMSALLLCLKSVDFPGLGKCFVEERYRERKDEKQVRGCEKVIFLFKNQ